MEEEDTKEESVKDRPDSKRKSQRDHCFGFEDRGRDKNQGMRQPLEAGKGKEMYLP